MKSAKTAGGIRQFSTNEATVAKWVMNRPFQTRFAETLMELMVFQKQLQAVENAYVQVKY